MSRFGAAHREATVLQCLREYAPDGTLPAADPLVPTEWGITGLEEITALVLASPQLPGPSQPDLLELIGQ